MAAQRPHLYGGLEIRVAAARREGSLQVGRNARCLTTLGRMPWRAWGWEPGLRAAVCLQVRDHQLAAWLLLYNAYSYW